jgi:hypothetical protein
MRKLLYMFCISLLVVGCDNSDIEKTKKATTAFLDALNTESNSEETKLRSELEKSVSVEYGGLCDYCNDSKGAVEFTLINNSSYQLRRLTFSFKIFANGQMVYDTGDKPSHSWVLSTDPYSRSGLTYNQISTKDDVYHLIKSASNVSVKIGKIYPLIIKKDAGEVNLYKSQ